MNSHFCSQVRLSCDGKLTRNRANSNFHPQSAIVILAPICESTVVIDCRTPSCTCQASLAPQLPWREASHWELIRRSHGTLWFTRLRMAITISFQNAFSRIKHVCLGKTETFPMILYCRKSHKKWADRAQWIFIGNWKPIESHACDQAASRNYTGSKMCLKVGITGLGLGFDKIWIRLSPNWTFLKLLYGAYSWRDSVTIFSDFFRFFGGNEKWQLLEQVSGMSDLTAWSATQTTSPPLLATYAGYGQHSRRWQVEQESHDFTRRHRQADVFVFRLQGPSKLISLFSKFKTSSDS